MTKKDNTNQSDAANLAAAGHASGSGEAGKSAADAAKEQGGTSQADLKDAPKSTDASADEEAARLRAADPEVAKQAERDASRRQRRDDPTLRTANSPAEEEALERDRAGRESKALGLDSPEGRLAQHAEVDRANERRNERNEEGHARNMDAIKQDGIHVPRMKIGRAHV